jgi:hypothetical protein
MNNKQKSRQDYLQGLIRSQKEDMESRGVVIRRAGWPNRTNRPRNTTNDNTSLTVDDVRDLPDTLGESTD